MPILTTDDLPYREGFRKQRTHAPMTNGPQIVIEGTREDWPGDAQTFAPLPAERDTQRHAFWFGAQLDPGDNEVWFRITPEAIERMRERTSEERGARLVDALLTWMGENPGHQLNPRNAYQVFVSDAGDARLEPHRD